MSVRSDKLFSHCPFLNCKFLSSLCPPCSKNLSSAGCAHSGSESVHFAALSLFGLIGHFSHLSIPPYTAVIFISDIMYHAIHDKTDAALCGKRQTKFFGHKTDMPEQLLTFRLYRFYRRASSKKALKCLLCHALIFAIWGDFFTAAQSFLYKAFVNALYALFKGISYLRIVFFLPKSYNNKVRKTYIQPLILVYQSDTIPPKHRIPHRQKSVLSYK